MGFSMGRSLPGSWPPLGGDFLDSSTVNGKRAVKAGSSSHLSRGNSGVDDLPVKPPYFQVPAEPMRRECVTGIGQERSEDP